MTVVVVILFYILKNKDYIYTEDDTKEVVLCFDSEEQVEFNDKTILDVIDITAKTKVKKNTTKKGNNKEKSSTKKVDKTNNSKSKTVNKSKTTVKK